MVLGVSQVEAKRGGGLGRCNRAGQVPGLFDCREVASHPDSAAPDIVGRRWSLPLDSESTRLRRGCVHQEHSCPPPRGIAYRREFAFFNPGAPNRPQNPDHAEPMT